MKEKETIEETPVVEAPVTVAEPISLAPVMPRQRQVERQGTRSEPYTERFPRVIGGVCEFCGVKDPNVRSEDQYKLCSHYAGMQLRCSYCDESKNPDDVIGHAELKIAAHPDNPNTLIVWCDSYTCSQKHEQRFRRA